MTMGQKVKMLMVVRGISMTELAKRLESPMSRQNLTKKIKADNLREQDLQEIAKACDATFEGSFILNDSGEKI